MGQFFAQLLTQAEARGLTINWGVKGFSLRVPRSGEELCSIFYGSPPDADGKKMAFIQAYLGDLRSEDDAEEIRASFLGAAPFMEKGRYTLELFLTHEDMRAAEEATTVLFAVAAQLSQ